MSSTFAQLVESITLNPTIVYVEWSESLPSRLDAALMTNATVAPDGTCVLRVLVRRRPPNRSLIPVIAHELQHVLELLRSPGLDAERTSIRSALVPAGRMKPNRRGSFSEWSKRSS